MGFVGVCALVVVQFSKEAAAQACVVLLIEGNIDSLLRRNKIQEDLVALKEGCYRTGVENTIVGKYPGTR